MRARRILRIKNETRDVTGPDTILHKPVTSRGPADTLQGSHTIQESDYFTLVPCFTNKQQLREGAPVALYSLQALQKPGVAF